MAEWARPYATEPALHCHLCGARGRELYRGLRDLVQWVAEGEWRLLRCEQRECGLVWLDPRPAAPELARLYRRENADSIALFHRNVLDKLLAAVVRAHLRVALGYDRGVGPRWQAILAPLARLYPGRLGAEAEASYLPAPADERRSVLDVGCGDGRLIARLRELGWQVEGVETDPAAVQAAAANGIHARLGYLESQSFSDKTFDAVVMSHVVEHLHDPARVLRECLRVLRPGGWLVMLTPNVESAGHARFGPDWIGLDPPRHLYLFGRKSLRSLLLSAGFEVVEVQSSARWARYSLLASREVATRSGRASPQGRWERPFLRAISFLYALESRVVVRFRRDSGDELMVRARRP